MLANLSNKGRLFGPDLLRALAIVLVLLSHTLPGGTEYPVLGAARYYFGFLGVEIFFVLSGFLIGGILIKELYSDRLDSMSGIVSFWKRRWFRTLPNYYLFLLIILLLDRFNSGTFADAGKFLWFGAFFYHAPVFFTQAWSLSIEEWFYLLFPLVLFVFAKLLKNPRAAVLTAIAIFIVMPAILRFFLPATSEWDMGVRLVTLPRLDAIAYGVFLAFTQKIYPGIWRLLAKLSPLGIIAVLGLFGHYCCYRVSNQSGFTSDLTFYRVFYFCIVSSCLVLAFPGVLDLTEPAGWWKIIVQKLSLWSYSIYLSHGPVIALVGSALRRLGVNYFQAHVDSFILTWLLCIPLSALVYLIYEKPFMDLRDRPFKAIFSGLHRKPLKDKSEIVQSSTGGPTTVI